MSKDEYGFDPDETILLEDNPFWDVTDAAHPAWWRGYDYTVKMMDYYKQTFKSYEDTVLPLAVYPNRGNNFVYPALGLAGESGEVADKIKKVLRDSNGKLTEERRVALVKELGDVLWYVCAMANELGETLQSVAQKNIEKLLLRNKNDTIHGNGDDR